MSPTGTGEDTAGDARSVDAGGRQRRTAPEAATQVDGVAQVDVPTAAHLVQEGALLLDVREAEERRQARIAGSLHIPLQRLPDRFEELPKDRFVVVYCASGARSHSAARFLSAQGFEAANLMHGIVGWYRMGRPIETE